MSFTALRTGGQPLAARASRITYRSTSATGSTDTVTGTLLVPTAAATGTRPLVSFAVGTQGMADRCAPSAQLAAGTEYEAIAISELLVRGWAVVVTDYPGLGSPGEHPYAIGRALGPAVLDAIRAARQVPGAGLSATGPAAVMGYSEGGGAAGWAAQLQPTYAPDVPLVGAAVGGVTADLRAIAESLDKSSSDGLLGYAIDGIAAAYPAAGVTTPFTAAGKADLQGLLSTCVDDLAVQHFPEDLATIVTANPLTTPAVAQVLTDNTLGASAPTTPVLLVHSRVDDLVPFAQAQALAQTWCREGARLDAQFLPTGGHGDADVVFVADAVDWLGDRFDGQAAPSTC